ncbi:SpoIIE family protein phosphatase, partial [Crocinitomix catalasitica]|nr:SpoIIE family protein phosphatase [Crocinitomix catalasitica]
DLEMGDTFYLFSDGYTDQFGGDNVKKFNRKRFRNLLMSIYEFKMKKQGKELALSFNSWKGKHEQIDDVCVIGVRV